jgi:threonine aldolase
MPTSVDLSSDTVTLPTEEMRKAMYEAEVGDEQKGEDPTVNRLLALVTELLGKEAALFVPSGTMCNKIAFAIYCQRPGDEVIMARNAHANFAEPGALSANMHARVQPIDVESGIFTAQHVELALRPVGPYFPRSRVVSIEQTTNLGGGCCWPLQTVQEVCSEARRHGLGTHLVGARLLNAVVATGVAASEYAQPCDSVWLSLSKGLGAPFGAVLAGSEGFIEEAWWVKRCLGGAMRQIGIMAAAGIYALEHHVERLAEDHANAQLLARGLADIPGIRVHPEVETNIVLFDVAGTALSAQQFVDRLLHEHGIRFFAPGTTATRVRAMTHLHINREAIDRTLVAVAAALTETPSCH